VKDRKAGVARKTKETDISIELSPDKPGLIKIESGIPFFDHLLNAMAFHGDFSLRVTARGDAEVDPHHMVEDVGLVLGDVWKKLISEHGHIKRFGHAVIPMDEALAEVTLDVCGRPSLVYRAEYPQGRVGDFDLALLREFFLAVTSRAGMSLHAHVRYGENSHHMAESLFKALGKALKQAYAAEREVLSTKGTLESR
jgi:imidazoleglycerol-phosphate dehydratase